MGPAGKVSVTCQPRKNVPHTVLGGRIEVLSRPSEVPILSTIHGKKNYHNDDIRAMARDRETVFCYQDQSCENEGGTLA